MPVQQQSVNGLLRSIWTFPRLDFSTDVVQEVQDGVQGFPEFQLDSVILSSDSDVGQSNVILKYIRVLYRFE